jgi:hypothetical protein
VGGQGLQRLVVDPLLVGADDDLAPLARIGELRWIRGGGEFLQPLPDLLVSSAGALPPGDPIRGVSTLVQGGKFHTFRPGTAAVSCQPGLGTNRLYRVGLFNGAPLQNLDGVVDDDLALTDRYVEAEGGILPTPQLIFTSDDMDNDGIPDGIDNDRDGDGILDNVDDDLPEQCEGEDCGGTVVCVGMMCFPPGFTNTPVRTYWFQENVDN